MISSPIDSLKNISLIRKCYYAVLQLKSIMYDLPHGYAQTQNRNLKAKFYFYQNKSNRKAVDIRNDARPLILISQVQRSGGTLLSQLFDGTLRI